MRHYAKGTKVIWMHDGIESGVVDHCGGQSSYSGNALSGGWSHQDYVWIRSDDSELPFAMYARAVVKDTPKNRRNMEQKWQRIKEQRSKLQEQNQ